MVHIESYMVDGAKMQEVCVMAYVRHHREYIVEESWDKEYKDYRATVEVARYYNCREQGYTFCLYYNWSPVSYVTVFEHRNSDSLCILVNDNKLFSECPTSDEVWGDREDKWAYDKGFEYMHIEECGEYIIKHFKERLHETIEKSLEDKKE